MPLPTLPNPNCTNQKNDWMRSKTQQWRGRSPLSSLLCRGATRTHRQEPKLANSDRFPHLESWRWWNRWEFWHQELQRLLKSWTKRHLREPQHGGPAWWNHVHQPRSWCQVMGCWYFGAAIESKGRIWKTERHIIIDYYTYIYDPPCNLGGGAGTPDSVEGPNVRHPVSTLLNQSLLSRVGSYLLQDQEPSTAKISDKENSCFLQNQEPHMCKHQNNWKNITCWVKTSKDDSVEICVRVDSVEMFCRSMIL